MRSGYKNISGSKIYYEIFGLGEPLIFIHADALDCRQWDNQIEYFSNKFKTIRYDQRGFGKSDIPSDTPYSFADDLDKLMQALNISKAHLIGLSLGAAEVINFTVSHPEKVFSIVLADAGIDGDGFNQEFRDAVKTPIELAKKGKIGEAKKAWSNLHFLDSSRSNLRVWNLVLKMINDTSGYRWYGTNQPIHSKPLSIERLEEIHVPTLILVGEQDIPDFQRKSLLLHKRIPGSEFLVVSNAGHLSNMDNPFVFNKVVDSFLSKLRKR